MIALVAVLGWFSPATISLYAQGSVKEYIRLGGRVIAIENQSMSIAPVATLPAGTTGIPYSATLTITGGVAPYTWASTGLPAGFTVQRIGTGASATLTGTFTASGTYQNITITVTDSSSPHFVITQPYSVTVSAAPLAFSGSATLASGTTGVSYSTSLTATGGAAPYTWSYDALPPGLSLSGNGATATLTGTPTSGGTYSINITVKDGSSPQLVATRLYTVTIATGLAFSGSAALASGTTGVSYSASLTATGGVAPYTWSYDALPPGLSLPSNGATATLTGTPTSSGTYSINITVRDGSSPQLVATRLYTVTIAAVATLTIAGPASLTTAQVGISYSATFTASGGVVPYTWSITGLPSGLSGSAGGVISGAAAAGTAGAYNLAVRVTDSRSSPVSVQEAIVLNVVAPLTSPYGSSFSLGTFPLGYSTFSMQLQASGGTYPYNWTGSGLPSWLALTTGGNLSVSGAITGGTGTYSFTVSATDSGSPQLTLPPVSFSLTVTSGALCEALDGSPGVYAGQSVGAHVTDCVGNAAVANWAVSGRGSVYPATNSSTTNYTAPLAVYMNETAYVDAYSSATQASSAMQVVLLPPTPVLSPANTTVNAGQATRFTISASQADGWTSNNDYVILDFDGSGSYFQYSNSCYLWYQPTTHLVYLATDNATSLASYTWGTLGASQTLSNSQCSLNLSSATASVNGAILTLSVPVTFLAGYPGQKTVFAQAYPDTNSIYFPVGSVTSVSPAPSLASLSPTSGVAGTSVTITGSNFGVSQWQSTVTFNGVAAAVTSWNANSIVATVPAAASTGNVVATVGGVASNGLSFTFVPTPSITSLSPSAGPIGTSVTIAGANFGATTGTVKFNGTTATVTSWSPTSILVTVPSGATSGNVVVTASSSVSSPGVNFTISSTVVQNYASYGTFTWIAPTGVTSVKVQCWGPGGNGGSQSSYPAAGGGGGGAYAVRNSATVVPGTQYSVVVGAGGSTTKTSFAGSVCVADYGQVGVINTFNYGGPGGQASNSTGDSVTSGGDGGAGGGQGGGHGGAGANGGSGGGTSSSCGNPAYPGGAPGGGGGGGCSSGFSYPNGGSGAPGQVTLTYTPIPPSPPTLSAISPAIGVQGTAVAVTLTGTNFIAGATVATNNTGIAVSAVNIVSATQITATFTLTANATLGAANVTVTTTGGTSAPVVFTVKPPPPTVSAISPAIGVQGTAVAVTLTGTNFVSGATVATNNTGIAVVGVTVVSATQITATFTLTANATLGAANVTVTTAGGTSAGTTFTVNAIPVDLHLANLAMNSGSATYQATHSITADTSVVIGGAASVTFTAGTIITLDPGFHATAGGSGTAFHAVIQ